ncbi:MAG TPA: hypothetical protein DCY20_01210 [Firmicutes bacterium]|nr:hypothetical protein [Bacillota bacterium]
MKNIVVINSSLKGKASSTLNITNAFLEGYRLVVDDAKIEYFHLTELNIQTCMDCEGCNTNTSRGCHFVDDMSYLLERYQAADLIIHNFSLNHNGLPSLLQTFIERMRPLRTFVIEDEMDGHVSVKSFYNRPADSKFVIISTCRSTNIEESYKAVNVRVDQNFNGKATKLFFPSTLYPYVNETISGIDFFKAIQWAGQDFAKDGEISKPVYEILYRFCPNTKQNIVIPADCANTYFQLDLNYEKLRLIGLGKLSPLKETYDASRLKLQNQILEIKFTDINESYQLILKSDELEIIPKGNEIPHGELKMCYQVFGELVMGKMDVFSAVKLGVLTYHGDIKILNALNNGLLYKPNKKSEDMSLLLSNGVNKDWVNHPLNHPIIAYIPWLLCLVIMGFNITLGLCIGLMASILTVLFKRLGDTTLLDKFNVLIFLITSGIVYMLSKIEMRPVNDIVIILSLVSSIFYGSSLFTKIPITAYIGYRDYYAALSSIEIYVKKHQVITFVLTTMLMVIPLVEMTVSFLHVNYSEIYIIASVVFTLLIIKWISVNYGKWMYSRVSKNRGHKLEDKTEHVKI